MNKQEQLEEAIGKLPPEFQDIKETALFILDCGELSLLRAYIRGAFAATYALTSDDEFIAPLVKIRELLS